MRRVAYKALQASDLTSIDILACCVVPYTLTRDYGEFDANKPKAEDMHFKPGEKKEEGHTMSKAKCGVLVREQFKEMFNLNDDELEEAIKRGEKELEKPERQSERELHQFKKDEACAPYSLLPRTTSFPLLITTRMIIR